MSKMLAGLHVLLPRPEHQARSLAERIEALGGRVIIAPVMAIEPITPAITAWPEDGIYIFTSRNAVENCPPTLPRQATVLAIGPATGSALEATGFSHITLAPPPGNSESLLTLPILQSPITRPVILVKGAGGRDVLPTILAQRAQRFSAVETYRRVPAGIDPARLCQQIRSCDLIVITSGEIARNLSTLCQASCETELRSKKLLLINERLRNITDSLGLDKSPLIAVNATEMSLLETLIAYAKAHHEQR